MRIAAGSRGEHPPTPLDPIADPKPIHRRREDHSDSPPDPSRLAIARVDRRVLDLEADTLSVLQLMGEPVRSGRRRTWRRRHPCEQSCRESLIRHPEIAPRSRPGLGRDEHDAGPDGRPVRRRDEAPATGPDHGARTKQDQRDHGGSATRERRSNAEQHQAADGADRRTGERVRPQVAPQRPSPAHRRKAAPDRERGRRPRHDRPLTPRARSRSARHPTTPRLATACRLPLCSAEPSDGERTAGPGPSAEMPPNFLPKESRTIAPPRRSRPDRPRPEP